MSPSTADVFEVHVHQLQQQARLPPTPEITPTTVEAISKRSSEKVNQARRLSPPISQLKISGLIPYTCRSF